MFRRSGAIVKFPDRAGTRALLKSVGYSDYDLDRPLIGIANAWSTIVPGHYNLRQIAGAVRDGILQAGGTPVEFGVIGVCDGVANGHAGGKYSLPSRDLIAASIETAVEAHRLDAVVLLGSCDKTVPGMLMAAARMDIPALLVPGGPMSGGVVFDGRESDITSLSEALGMYRIGKADEDVITHLENGSAPTCGSCSFLGTANTMCCLAEAMGMTLPYGGTAPAVSAARLRLAQESGRAIVRLVEKGITSRQVINRNSLLNAIRVAMAIGGSTNAVLHILAIAHEAEADLSTDEFDTISRMVPHIARVYPAGPKNVIDFHNAGGVPAVMKEVASLLDTTALTVSGNTVEEIIASASTKDSSIIKTLDDPFSKDGGLAVLRGNLAPDTAVTKPAAIHPSMWTFTGPARVFESEESVNEAISAGRIKEGEVVVIRYEGPKGGPGMREMARALKMLYGMGLALKTAVITDGRFSGTNNGCFVGHISPEAAEGGPLAIVEDGDRITIDIPNRRLHLHLSDEEIKRRLDMWRRPPSTAPKGYLRIYSELAESASRGGVLRHRS